MKKVFSILLLGISISSLVGCTPSENNDISRISFIGSMTKKHYSYNDEWNLSGLSVRATYKSGDTRNLSKDEYTITFNKNAPKNYSVGLTITAKYKKDPSLNTSVSIKNIIVDDEVYDEESEISAYYSDCNIEKTSTNLLKELQRHSYTKHTYFVKYVETQSILSKNVKDKDYEAPDLIPNEHKLEMFYTGNKSNYYIGTREHVWACNDSSGLWPHGTVDDSSYYGGGSDLYHIRPCDSTVNTARGDAPYVDFDHPDFASKKSSVVEVGDEGPYKLKIYGASKSGDKYEYATLAEPADEFKGDIARIVAYVYMHYDEFDDSKIPSKYRSLTGKLDLTKVIGFSSYSKVATILKEWNNLDPVSEVEKRRNHTVMKIQGNRNPFVDYPELIDKAF